MPLYSLLLFLVLVLGAPFWIVRMLTSGRYRSGLTERLGFVPGRLARQIAGRPVLWLHAVSVGEVLAASELLAGLELQYPGHTIAISTTTESGQRLARERFPHHAVFYLPLDFATVIRRYLHVLKPTLLLLMESELWPNLIRESARCGARVVVANARISDRSFPRYRRLRHLWRPILRPVSLFLAQGEETAGRLRAIGVPATKLVVTGNLKYDVKAAPRGPLFALLQSSLPSHAPLLAAGSTIEGEEAQLLAAWPEVLRQLPSALLLLAPRHTPRFAGVAALAESRGFTVHRVSNLPATAPLSCGDVLLLDTIGDLAALYALATAAFVGGSLVPAGGHNPLEPARFGVPVIMGPSFENFREIVHMMQEGNAIRVLESPSGLAGALAGMLGSSAPIREMGERGRAIFRSQSGATTRTLAALAPLLAASEPHA